MASACPSSAFLRGFSGKILLAALHLALPGAAGAAFEPYVSYPTVHGDRLAFVSGGELWTGRIPEAPATEVEARRVAGPEGEVSHPAFSPDGRWLAFSVDRGGNLDVFALALEDGSIRRLTYHSSREIALGWAPDGKSVVFSSRRADPFYRPELWQVPLEGGVPVRYGFGPCSFASFEPGGKRLVFQTGAEANPAWRGYRGGEAPDLWIGDLESRRFERLAADPGNDLHPLWVGGRIVFLSDRGGPLDFYSIGPTGGDLRRHTSWSPDPLQPTAVEGYAVQWPSAAAQPGATQIVFTQGGRVALLDLADDRVRRLTVRLPPEVQPPAPIEISLDRALEGFGLSPDGGKLLLLSRGEIFVRPVESDPFEDLLDEIAEVEEVEEKDLGRVTFSSGTREWLADFANDRELLVLTDRGGHDSLVSMPLEGAQEGSTRTLLEFPATTIVDIILPGPQGRYAAAVDSGGHLSLADLRTGERWAAAEGWLVDSYNLRFSPDGRWLAYVAWQNESLPRVFLYSFGERRSFAVSDDFHADTMPRWDPAGRYLFFVSFRFLDPYAGSTGSGVTYFEAGGVFAVPLAAKTAPPDGVAQAADPAGEIRIDTEGLAGRAFPILRERNLVDLEAVRDGICWTQTAPRSLSEEEEIDSPLGPAIHSLYCQRFGQDEKEVADGVSMFSINADGSVLAYHHEGIYGEDRLTVYSLREGGEEDLVSLGEDAVEVDLGIAFRVDPREEWGQILGEAWRTYGDIEWYQRLDPQIRQAQRARYDALIPRLRSRAELEDLLAQMLAEVGISHAYTSPPEEEDAFDEEDGGLLGADLAFVDGVWRIERILSPGPWTSEMGRSPLSLPHLEITEGSVLLAIGDERLGPGSDPDRLLLGLADQTVRLTVASSASGEGSRTVEVPLLGLGEEIELRYGDWIERNRRRVEERSGGRIGYIHIDAMGPRGLARFTYQWLGQRNKAGLIVDVRGNAGGYVSPYILRVLANRSWLRQFGSQGWQAHPEDSFDGRLVTLIDGGTASNGEVFAESIRRLKLGDLVGTRTSGYLLGITEYFTVDSGRLTKPVHGYREADGRWLIENDGVAPDLPVEIGPEDFLLGRDPQLETALARLLQQLEAEAPPSPIAGARP